MTKTLILLRHAKSDWSDTSLKDFERTLNSRGRLDAPRMGKKLLEMGVKPDLILSSPAERAKLTAQFVSEQINYDTDAIVFDENIYEASARSLLSIINNIENKYSTVIIVGHNPTFTYIGEYLTKKTLDNVPTCGAVSIRFDVDGWEEVSGDIGNLEFFLKPKEDL